MGDRPARVTSRRPADAGSGRTGARPRAGRRSRFTAEERDSAVQRALHGEEAIEEVADSLGISASTIYRWSHDEGGSTAAGPASAALVEACQRLLAERCYSELSVELVASEAGVSSRAAFNHFSTKEELFRAAATEAGERVSAELVPIITELLRLELPPDEELGSILAAGLEASLNMPGVHVLFRDVGIPPPGDPTEVWHEAFSGICAWPILRAFDEGLLQREQTVQSAVRIVSQAARSVVAGAVTEAVAAHAAHAALRRLPLLVISPGDLPGR